MVKINKVEWGKIEVNGEKYGQVLICGDRVIERDSARLHDLFDTTHEVGDWEVEELLGDGPEMIIIGNGFAGVLKISEKLKDQISKQGIDLKILETPKAIDEFNRLAEQGKKVNALFHTTC